MPKLRTPETRTLGRALDEMRDSLEDRKYVETYVQTLTHEMKSPVAAIRGAADLLGEDAMPADQRGRFLDNPSTFVATPSLIRASRSPLAQWARGR